VSAAESKGYFDMQLAKSAFDAGQMRAQLAKSELDAVALKVRQVVYLALPST
jgi:hypothetical protein